MKLVGEALRNSEYGVNVNASSVQLRRELSEETFQVASDDSQVINLHLSL